jgi:pimeloyl-ACP methyl ester carboxylesterase
MFREPIVFQGSPTILGKGPLHLSYLVLAQLTDSLRYFTRLRLSTHVTASFYLRHEVDILQKPNPAVERPQLPRASCKTLTMTAPHDSLSRVEVNDVELAYRHTGNGDPMVLVHGHLSDHRTWTELEAKLSANFHVYSYSKRFAWPNTPIADGEPQPWEQDALDLGAFIETLGIGPVHALGNSSGSTAILCLARSKPHLFRTLLLEEPPVMTIFMPDLPPSPLAALSCLFWHPISFFPVMYYGATTIGPATELAKKGDDDGAILTFGAGCLGPKYWSRALANPERRKQIEDNAKYLCNFMRHNSLPVYTTEDAKNIELPTLVLTSADTPYFQKCIDAKLVKICGAAKKREVYIEDAGHLMHEDNPDAVFKAVLAFTKDGSVAS